VFIETKIDLPEILQGTRIEDSEDR